MLATALVFYTYDHFVLFTAPYVRHANLRLYRFLALKWGFDTIYNRFLNKPLLQGAYNIPFSLIDKGLLEQAGPTGLGKAATALGRWLTTAQTGRVSDYAAIILLAALLCAVVFSLYAISPLEMPWALLPLLVSTTRVVSYTAPVPVLKQALDGPSAMQLNFKHRPINGAKPATILVSNHFLYYPTPSSLSYNWSFGSLAGLFFALQIVTGVILAMHYTPHVEWAFTSVEHIMTDVTGGYLFRYFHANGASMIFILIYLHVGRNLYYQSYTTRPVL